MLPSRRSSARLSRICRLFKIRRRACSIWAGRHAGSDCRIVAIKCWRSAVVPVELAQLGRLLGRQWRATDENQLRRVVASQGFANFGRDAVGSAGDQHDRLAIEGRRVGRRAAPVALRVRASSGRRR